MNKKLLVLGENRDRSMAAQFIAVMAALGNRPFVVFKKVVKAVKSGIEIGAMVRACPGGRHAWYDSNVGIVRKPIARGVEC